MLSQYFFTDEKEVEESDGEWGESTMLTEFVISHQFTSF
jgi:hypothetical protein